MGHLSINVNMGPTVKNHNMINPPLEIIMLPYILGIIVHVGPPLYYKLKFLKGSIEMSFVKILTRIILEEIRYN